MLTPPRVVVCLCVFLLTAAANAELIIPGSCADGPPDGELSDVKLSVDLTVAGGVAVMTFVNVSAGTETSAVFKEIVVDTCDDDTGTAVLWDPMVLNQPPGVSYAAVESNGLPCFHRYTSDPTALLELRADPAPPKKGIGPGETLRVQFSTFLGDGAGINDYLAAFGAGSDTALYTIGFHAISASVMGGESLAGLYQQGEGGASSLTIYNFMDLNGNGVLDPGEPLMAGWDFLVEGNGFSGMFTTGPVGDLVVALQAGLYTVTAQGMAGWTFTTPYTYDLLIVNGTPASAEFGNIPEPSVAALFLLGWALRRRKGTARVR